MVMIALTSLKRTVAEERNKWKNKNRPKCQNRNFAFPSLPFSDKYYWKMHRPIIITYEL